MGSSAYADPGGGAHSTVMEHPATLAGISAAQWDGNSEQFQLKDMEISYFKYNPLFSFFFFFAWPPNMSASSSLQFLQS